jgi:hypothetical protein
LATENVLRRAKHELAQLQAWYECVQQGQRQLIFVSGEAGIGKITLAERFRPKSTPGSPKGSEGFASSQGASS